MQAALLTAAWTREAGAAVTVRTYWAWETTATLRLLSAAREALEHMHPRQEDGRGISCRHVRAQLVEQWTCARLVLLAAWYMVYGTCYHRKFMFTARLSKLVLKNGWKKCLKNYFQSDFYRAMFLLVSAVFAVDRCPSVTLVYPDGWRSSNFFLGPIAPS